MASIPTTTPAARPVTLADLPVSHTTNKPSYLVRLALHQEAMEQQKQQRLLLRRASSSSDVGGGEAGGLQCAAAAVGYLEPFTSHSVVYPTTTNSSRSTSSFVAENNKEVGTTSTTTTTCAAAPGSVTSERKKISPTSRCLPRAKKHLNPAASSSNHSSKMSSPIMATASSPTALGNSLSFPVEQQSSAANGARLPHPSATPFRVPVSYVSLPDLEELVRPTASSTVYDTTPTTTTMTTSYVGKLERLHTYCEKEERDCYLDPVTGELIFAANFLTKTGRCCGHRCRHCPFRDDDLPTGGKSTDSDTSGDDGKSGGSDEYSDSSDSSSTFSSEYGADRE